MKFSCICLTAHRPLQLANLIANFNCFNYPAADLELIVLDDMNQYPREPSGDNWQIFSVKRQFQNRGVKLAAAMGLTSSGMDAYILLTETGIYLPWTPAAHAAALGRVEDSAVKGVADDGNALSLPQWMWLWDCTRHPVDEGALVPYMHRPTSQGSGNTLAGSAFTLRSYQQSGGIPLHGEAGRRWHSHIGKWIAEPNAEREFERRMWDAAGCWQAIPDDAAKGGYPPFMIQRLGGDGYIIPEGVIDLVTNLDPERAAGGDQRSSAMKFGSDFRPKSEYDFDNLCRKILGIGHAADLPEIHAAWVGLMAGKGQMLSKIPYRKVGVNPVFEKD